jgi:hypothetical protein
MATQNKTFKLICQKRAKLNRTLSSRKVGKLCLPYHTKRRAMLDISDRMENIESVIVNVWDENSTAGSDYE